MNKIWILSIVIISLPLSADAADYDKEANARFQQNLRYYTPVERRAITAKVEQAQSKLTPAVKQLNEERIEKFEHEKQRSDEIRNKGDAAYAKLQRNQFRTEGDRQQAWNDAAAAGRVPSGPMSPPGVPFDVYNVPAIQPKTQQ